MDSAIDHLMFLAVMAVASGFAGTLLANAGLTFVLWATNEVVPAAHRPRAVCRRHACRRKPRLSSDQIAELIRRLRNPGRN